MVNRQRNGVGRPTLPAEERKGPLTCYMPIRVIEQLNAIATSRGTSRNKLMAQVLCEFAAAADHGSDSIVGRREAAAMRGR